MENILVSACLTGENVKYDGYNNLNDKVVALKKRYNFILICPEVMGGLLIPRVPAEVKNNKVITKDNVDVTKEYHKGAQIALELAKKFNCKKAILKSKSPSCGKSRYDGTFTHKLIDEYGITAQLLINNGIKVYTEEEIDNL
jgi:uncharacterized protein YbbK (DUF523 family)